MKLKFTKMHGLGNDFVVLDRVNQTIELTSDQMRFLADRHFGVGCDQILLVESSEKEDVDFSYRIFNADGGEVEQCGNGARCFARFVLDNNLTDKEQIAVETNSGIIILEVVKDNWVRVNMGVPVLEPEAIPIVANEKAKSYALSIGDQRIKFGAVSMGNPHAVLRVDSVKDAAVDQLGSQLEPHPFFPQRANIGFLEIENRSNAKLRVFERGVGETLACGTGACAAMVVGHLWNEFDDSVIMTLPGGDLQIDWKGEGEPVYLSGPADFVFTGEIEI